MSELILVKKVRISKKREKEWIEQEIKSVYIEYSD